MKNSKKLKKNETKCYNDNTDHDDNDKIKIPDEHECINKILDYYHTKIKENVDKLRNAISERRRNYLINEIYTLIELIES